MGGSSCLWSPLRRCKLVSSRTPHNRRKSSYADVATLFRVFCSSRALIQWYILWFFATVSSVTHARGVANVSTGEEFLLDYSDEYWEHSEHMDAVHQEIRFALF